MSRDAWHGTIKHGTVVTWFHTSNAGINKKSKTQHQQVSGYQTRTLGLHTVLQWYDTFAPPNRVTRFYGTHHTAATNIFKCTCFMLLVVFQDFEAYNPADNC